jgi:hypothetical protein
MTMIREEVTLLDGTIEIREYPAPVALLSEIKAERRKALADIRWRKSQMLTYDGIVAPADSAMSALTAVVVATQAGLIASGSSITWKLADNEFRDWSIQQLLAYGAAVQAHIQQCFVRESAFTALIDAATDEEALDAIDLEEGWPG